jgi:copper ion binding protein
MKEIKLKIEGMHCAGCSTRLERVLNNLEGVEEAKVSLEEKQATIKFDETKTNIENIKETIEDAGFKGE